MKKIGSILSILLLICGITVTSFAQATDNTTNNTKKNEASVEVVKGTITAIDPVKSEIVVKERKTGTEKTIVVDAATISSLKVDERVKVTLKTGTNVAEKVKEITKSAASTAKASQK
jgi:hypothetical protein